MINNIQSELKNNNETKNITTITTANSDGNDTETIFLKTYFPKAILSKEDALNYSGFTEEELVNLTEAGLIQSYIYRDGESAYSQEDLDIFGNDVITPLEASGISISELIKSE